MADQVKPNVISALVGWFWDSALGQWVTRRLACTDAGELKTRQTGSDVAFPEQWFLNDGVTAKTAAALMTTADISGYAHGMFVISGLGTETIAVTGLIDGIIATGALKIQKTDGTYVAGATLGNGTYYLQDLAVKNLKFDKSAALDPCTFTLALKA